LDDQRSALILFACSSLRHALFQEPLIWEFMTRLFTNQSGQPPISSFLGFHPWATSLGGLSPKFAIQNYPDVHWLLAVQAVALALGALPMWHLARHAGLTVSKQ